MAEITVTATRSLVFDTEDGLVSTVTEAVDEMRDDLAIAKPDMFDVTTHHSDDDFVLDTEDVIATEADVRGCPPGTYGTDRDGWFLVKVTVDYWVAYERGTREIKEFDNGELLGAYTDGESRFLPITGVVMP